MEESYLDLKKFISVATQLAFIASKFAKECSENPDLKKYQKKKNDPVTQADFKVQTLIVNGIRHFFPNIRIVGEESIDYDGEININFGQISTTNCPQNLQFDEKALLSQFCVWIDPIDNTKGFINGTLDCVTILIGLSRNKRSYIGITAIPFCKEEQKFICRPEILLGIAPLLKAFSSFESHKWTLYQKNQPNKSLKFVVSDSKQITKTLKEIAEKNSAQIVRIGGSGIKIVNVGKGKMDVLVYIGACNHKWDTCPGQALIVALGGLFGHLTGKPIEYDPDKPTINTDGNLCSLNQDLFHKIVEELAKYNP